MGVRRFVVVGLGLWAGVAAMVLGAAEPPTPAAAEPPAVDDRATAPAEPSPAPESSPPADRVWYDSVTVTATRSSQDRTDVPANVSVLSDRDIRDSASITLDGVLRQVPGFATQREQSSLVGSVQSQAVSLRGLGGTTTSRTLLLLDGIPMNDPYGGWVYWVKAPRELIERVEVVRGGGASIWGNLALGGVINMMTIEPTARSLSVSSLIGEHRTTDSSLALADAGDAWSGWLSGNYLDTDGYETVRADLRGPVDEPFSKSYNSFVGKASFAPSPRVSFHASADTWSEDRKRGTPLDWASAEAWSAVANASMTTGRGGWELHLFDRHQDWESFSTRPSLDRTTETPSSFIFDQPSDVLGASAVWSREVGGEHRLMAGADGQWIEIEHHQDLGFRSGRFNERADVEGSQDLAGAFVQDVFTPGARWSVQAGTRVDHIRNHDGSVTNSDPVTGAVTSMRDLADHEETSINPSLGGVYQANESVSLRASTYTGFRAPTPGELYKGFRTGSAVTESNSELEPESLRGAEIGADYRRSTRFFGRVTGFWNELEDLILQTTVGVAGPAGAIIEPCGAIAPRGVCRQRNNVGRVRAVGVEIEGEYRPSPRWSFALSSLLEETEVVEAPELHDLVGKRLPQAPEETVALRVRFSDPEILDALVQGRYVGTRFEDDVNTIPIDEVVVADVTLSRRLSQSISLFAGVENLFDNRYEVARDTTGLVLVERRLAHVGVRFNYR